MAHPVNNFIVPGSCNAPAPGACPPFSGAEFRRGIRRSLGRNAARLPQIRRRTPTEMNNPLGPASGRLSRACVIEKNLAWSALGQYCCLNFGRKPGIGIAAPSVGVLAPKIKARPFVGDAERRGPEFRTLRLAEDERWPDGCRKRPRCADDGEAVSLIERTRRR